MARRTSELAKLHEKTVENRVLNLLKNRVVFSDFVLKYNKYTRSQKRAIVISTSCLFNYSPKVRRL